jgi:hypothetical protein
MRAFLITNNNNGNNNINKAIINFPESPTNNPIVIGKSDQQPFQHNEDDDDFVLLTAASSNAASSALGIEEPKTKTNKRVRKQPVAPTFSPENVITIPTRVQIAPSIHLSLNEPANYSTTL